jgi:hypothetical protein
MGRRNLYLNVPEPVNINDITGTRHVGPNIARDNPERELSTPVRNSVKRDTKILHSDWFKQSNASLLDVDV